MITKEKKNAKAREYYALNREKLKAYHYERNKKRREDNREKYNAIHREWEIKNPEKIKEYNLKRKKKTVEKYLAISA